jgi:hypothetical protein
MKSYTNKNENEMFTAAQEQYESIRTQLVSAESSKLEHGDVEALLDREGKELLRRLFQAYLDLQSVREERLSSVTGSDNVVRTRVRHDKKRALETLFGTVELTRYGYGASGIGGLYPLDGRLNLPNERYSHGLEERVLEEVAKNSFSETVATIDKTTGGHIPKRQVEELARKGAMYFDEFYESRTLKTLADADDLLILTTDGKGIVVREKDLRDATRKAAEKAKQKRRKKRLGKGEKRNRKRMATVAAVYSVGPNIRTAEQVMGIMCTEAGTQEPPQKRPRPSDKRVWASVEKEPDEVMDAVFLEALKRDPEKRRRWVFLVDGDNHQLDRIRDFASLHDVEITVIVDIIHVIEYLWKASYGFFKEGSEEAEAWVTQRALRVLRGEASQVAAGMRRSATKRKLSDEKRKPIDTCAKYLLNHRDYLHYNEYLAAGMPIATGVIEGACRHLVKDRMDLTGARWRLRGAEAVLKLRALRSSGDFGDYWRFYKEREHFHNHASRYAAEVDHAA